MMKKLLLVCGIAASLSAQGNTCDVSERYKILDTNVQVNDVVTLSVGGTSVTKKLNAKLATDGKWQAKLSQLLNRKLNAEVADTGSLETLTSLNRYLPTTSGTDTTIIDVFQDNVPVSLSINGIDQTSLLEPQQMASAQTSGEIFIPHWFASTNRHLSFFVTNKSDVSVNVDVDIQYYNGNPYTGSYTSQFAFSGNNPVASTAVLDAGEQGQIGIGYLSGRTLGHATVSWSSNECVTDPITVTVSQHSNTGAMSHYSPQP